MGLQTIIDKCSGLTINRRKMVSIQYTKNEAVKTQRTPGFNPWRFTLEMESGLLYSQNRNLLEALDTLDRNQSEIISLGDNPKLRWLFRYQGDLTLPQRQALRVASFTNDDLVLTGLPAIPPAQATNVLFRPNDLIQIGDLPFPFTVKNTVLRGTQSFVVVKTHRPNFLPNNVVNSPITVGSQCKFRMICVNMPTYRLIPGGALINNNELINNARIEFSDAFELYEFI